MAKVKVTKYFGYYRESAKYKTEWYFIKESFVRKEVREKLNQMIKDDRYNRYYGSRAKIEKREVEVEVED